MYRKFYIYFFLPIFWPLRFSVATNIKKICYNNRWSFWAAILVRSSLGGGVGGLLTKVLYGEAPPWGPTPDPFIYHFWQKGTPFVYRLLTNVTPFTHIAWTPFLTAVNAPSLKHEQITNLERIMDFFTSTKCNICQPFWAFVQTEMTDFPALLSVASISDSLPYHIPEAWKRYPLRAESNLLV